jgi:hypothetical protein
MKETNIDERNKKESIDREKKVNIYCDNKRMRLTLRTDLADHWRERSMWRRRVSEGTSLAVYLAEKNN